jgi:hypothetical protein
MRVPAPEIIQLSSDKTLVQVRGTDVNQQSHDMAIMQQTLAVRRGFTLPQTVKLRCGKLRFYGKKIRLGEQKHTLIIIKHENVYVCFHCSGIGVFLVATYQGNCKKQSE